MSERRQGPRGLVVGVQALVSIGVVVLLLHQDDLSKVGRALAESSLSWLAVALVSKTASLTLFQVRLWVSLMPENRRPLPPIVKLGYAAALVNTVLPIRSGDLFAIVLLKTEQRVPVGGALSAVALTSLLEALVFGVFLVGVLVSGATQFEVLIGTARTAWATRAVGLLALGCLVVGGALVLLARRLAERPEPGEGTPPLLDGLRGAIIAAGRHLQHPRLAAANLALAGAQVALLVLTCWCLLPAVGADPELSVLAVSAILALTSLASVALPPSMAAGPAAVAVLVLGFFGVDETRALAFAALTWVVNVVPVALIGAAPLWGRVGLVGRTVLEEGD